MASWLWRRCQGKQESLSTFSKELEQGFMRQHVRMLELCWNDYVGGSTLGLAQKHLSKVFAYGKKAVTGKSKDPMLGEGKIRNLPYFKKHENCTSFCTWTIHTHCMSNLHRCFTNTFTLGRIWVQQSSAFHLFGGQNKEKPNLPIDDLTQSNIGLKKIKWVQCFLSKVFIQFLLNKIHCLLTVNKKTNTVKPLECG